MLGKSFAFIGLKARLQARNKAEFYEPFVFNSRGRTCGGQHDGKPVCRPEFGVAFANSFKGIEKSMAIGGAIGVSYANGINPWTGKTIAAKTESQPEYTYTKSAEKHLTEVVKHGANKGELARPYMKSPLTIQEIMSTGKGIPDATFKGGFNWRAPGTFRGSQGIWELGINTETNIIYHFNFKY